MDNFHPLPVALPLTFTSPFSLVHHVSRASLAHESSDLEPRESDEVSFLLGQGGSELCRNPTIFLENVMCTDSQARTYTVKGPSICSSTMEDATRVRTCSAVKASRSRARLSFSPIPLSFSHKAKSVNMRSLATYFALASAVQAISTSLHGKRAVIGSTARDIGAQTSILLKREDVDPSLLYPERNFSTPIDHFHNQSQYEPHSNGSYNMR